MKSLSILGSTGSIGTQTLDVVRQFPDKYEVKGLAVGRSWEKILPQIEEFEPEAVAIFDDEAAKQLREKTNVKVYSGMDGLNKLATLESADTIVTSVVGAIGVRPTVEALKAGKNVALANKETLVAAGSIVMPLVEKNKVSLTPIDSEHSALFQCLQGEEVKNVSRLWITCSGGAFKKWSKEELKTAKASDALKHPTWAMGAKITIDSATLMNKGLEIIEAHWLYDIPFKNIVPIGHPQSIIHSMVEYNDGSFMAQLGPHDMRFPIQYALSHPERFANDFPKLNPFEYKSLEFKKLDEDTFPCLRIAMEQGELGGVKPAAMNASNEVAVYAFLKNEIGFYDIPKIVQECSDSAPEINNPSLEQILDADEKARIKARELIENDGN